jgi:hypothetical protein
MVSPRQHRGSRLGHTCSGSSASGASPDHDSTDDYPEIGDSTCWNSAEEGRFIIMVASTGAP